VVKQKKKWLPFQEAIVAFKMLFFTLFHAAVGAAAVGVTAFAARRAAFFLFRRAAWSSAFAACVGTAAFVIVSVVATAAAVAVGAGSAALFPFCHSLRFLSELFCVDSKRNVPAEGTTSR
jgi:hypothetical protein